MTTTTASATEVAAFAAAVRAWLADLPADEADDLVEGLESDLLDQRADAGEAPLGDPAAYADELRAAAGLPPRSGVDGRRGLRVRLRDRTRRVQERLAGLRAHRWIAETLDFLVSLRAVWWLARGWVMYLVVAPLAGRPTDVYPILPGGNLFVGENFARSLLLGAALVVSVQWGRGRWAHRRWLRMGRRVVSVGAAVTLPFLLGWAAHVVAVGVDADRAIREQTVTTGMTVDGSEVRNIFAYDAAGTPIDTVQLFDQDGRPLLTVGEGCQMPGSLVNLCGGSEDGTVAVARVDDGGAVWNVYPLAAIDVDAVDRVRDVDDADIAGFPYRAVSALRGVPAPTPTPAP